MDLIKLHLTFEKPLEFEGGTVTGESIWALRISPTTAKINNIPFGTQDLALGDLVEFDADNEIIAVIERATRTRLAAYDPGPSDADATERYLAISEFLARHDVLTEGAAPGAVALSLPLDLTDRELDELATDCPVPLTIAGSERGEDRPSDSPQSPPMVTETTAERSRQMSEHTHTVQGDMRVSPEDTEALPAPEQPDKKGQAMNDEDFKKLIDLARPATWSPPREDRKAVVGDAVVEMREATIPKQDMDAITDFIEGWIKEAGEVSECYDEALRYQRSLDREKYAALKAGHVGRRRRLEELDSPKRAAARSLAVDRAEEALLKDGRAVEVESEEHGAAMELVITAAIGFAVEM